MTGAPMRFVTLGRCALCGSAATRERFVLEDFWFGSGGRFVYRACDACGTVYQDPRVAAEDVPRLYPPAYYTHAPSAADAPPPAAPPRALTGPRDRWRAAVQRAAQGRGGLAARAVAASRALRQRAFFGLTDELIPRASDRRVLEIGSGGGHLLALLARAGWPQVEGLDFDAAAAVAARARSGRPVHVSAFPDDDLPEAAFDLVVLVHVFEHFVDPNAALARLRALLAPGGRVVIIGPNPRSLGARVFGRSWIGWEPPRHLVVPPIAALGDAGRRHGLRRRRSRTRTRFAEEFAIARAWRAGRPAGAVTAVTAADRAWRWVGGALAGAGSELGEEMVVVLDRAE